MKKCTGSTSPNTSEFEHNVAFCGDQKIKGTVCSFPQREG